MSLLINSIITKSVYYVFVRVFFNIFTSPYSSLHKTHSLCCLSQTTYTNYRRLFYFFKIRKKYTIVELRHSKLLFVKSTVPFTFALYCFVIYTSVNVVQDIEYIHKFICIIMHCATLNNQNYTTRSKTQRNGNTVTIIAL